MTTYEATLVAEIKAGKRWVECAECGDHVTRSDVHFGDEWVCQDCHHKAVNPTLAAVSLIALAMTLA